MNKKFLQREAEAVGKHRIKLINISNTNISNSNIQIKQKAISPIPL